MGKANESTPETPSGLVPLKDVCEELGMHYNTAYRQRTKGVFPLEILVVGSRYKCRRADLDEYLRQARAS